MDLDAETVRELAAEYERKEAFHNVEQQHLDILPGMYADGEFGWRDVEWVVRWYYRRFMGAVPNRERREIEDEFGRNDFETVRDVFADVAATDDLHERIDRLADLDAVDVPLASAFLTFFDPDSYLVLGEREWTVLTRASALDEPYPEAPTASDYETYLETARTLAAEFDCDLWTLYQAVWRAWKDEDGAV
ncbi:MAG: hypothetical protein ABEI96_11510 [Haloarculaceae archaeon]